MERGARGAFKILVGVPYEEPINWVEIALAVIIIWTVMMVLASIASASVVITDEKAISAIIGEAENQGYDGMLAVACAIRNRGTLKGVYGLNAPRVRYKRYTKAIWLEAQKAWEKSEDLIKWDDELNEKSGVWTHLNYDPTHGAQFWEDTRAFGKPYWADKCKQTVIIKDHVFYKCPGYGKGE